MTRTAARVDANQAEIVYMLRKAGAMVQHLHTVGRGCPDVLVAYRGRNWLLEIKQPGGLLTKDEITWHAAWSQSGQVAIVHNITEALEAISAPVYTLEVTHQGKATPLVYLDDIYLDE